MSYKPTITMCHEGVVVDFNVYRDWGYEHLLVMCAMLACLTEGAESPDETRGLLAWFHAHLSSSNTCTLIEDIWRGRRDASFRAWVLEQGLPLLEEFNRERVRRYELCSQLPLVVDVGRRCVRIEGKGDHDTESPRTPISPGAINDSALSRILPEQRAGYVVERLVNGNELPFDILLGEESPAYDCLVHPELHLLAGDVAAREKGDGNLAPMFIDQEASLEDVGLGLSVRARGCLKRAGITMLGQLLAMSLEDLMGVRDMNMLSLWEIDDLLENFGMTIFDR